MNDYTDIIDIDYKGPKNHSRMTREKRASQFASFKALTGYEDCLLEERRIVDSKIILSEDKKELLDYKLKQINKNTRVKISYFIKDLKKDGGFYKTIITNINKIDQITHELVIENKERILIDNILSLDIIE